jgi:hypothetical protein
VKIRDGKILDHNGRPFEKGAVDPDLLKGILLAGGVAAYVATHPEDAEQVAWISGGALAIKGKGGNWHPDAVKALAEPLRQTLMPGSKLEAIPVLQARLRLGIDVENTQKTLTQLQAADRMVSSYLNKHAGTATDPLKDVRLPDGQRWGDVTDRAISPKKVWQYSEREDTMPGYVEGLKLRPPEEDIFTLRASSAKEALKSHLSHVGDFLRMNVKPEDLSKYDLVRAVKESAANDARVAKEMERAAAASTKDLPVYKDYGDGMKWVELKLPEELTPEQAKTVRMSNEIETSYVGKNQRAFIAYTALDAQGKPIKNNYTQDLAQGPTPRSCLPRRQARGGG